MAKRNRKPASERRAEDSPSAWFVMLETARGAGDPQGESRALTELRRLGVRVEFTRRQKAVTR